MIQNITDPAAADAAQRHFAVAASTGHDTLAELKSILAVLDNGLDLYQSMVLHAPADWGTLPGRHYILSITEHDGTERTVLSWDVRTNGSVDPVKVGMSYIR